MFKKTDEKGKGQPFTPDLGDSKAEFGGGPPAVIGGSLSVEGTIKGKEDLLVEGTVKGDSQMAGAVVNRNGHSDQNVRLGIQRLSSPEKSLFVQTQIRFGIHFVPWFCDGHTADGHTGVQKELQQGSHVQAVEFFGSKPNHQISNGLPPRGGQPQQSHVLTLDIIQVVGPVADFQ